MSEKCYLGEIAKSQTGPFGSQLHEEDYVSEGTPIVTVEHLGELGFTTQNLPFVSDEDVARLNKYTLKEGDIVFSRVGAIDRNTYVTKNENGWMFSGRCIRVRCDKSKVNPLYLSYYFRMDSFKRMMLNVSVGATMPSLNTDIMDTLPLELAERSEQDRIAKCLNNIDEKIRNNNHINSDLESMAKLLYDYWFVQFDFPDENGRPYKSSGGKMVWNKELKREIPEGWEVGSLYDIAEFINGLACQKYRPLDGTHRLPVIKIGEMHNGFGTDVEWARDDVSDKHIIHDGDILFSWSASLEVMLWNKGTGVLNQHIFKVIPKTNKYYVLQQLSSYIGVFVRMAEARKTTMGHITTDHLNQSRIVIPPKRVVDMYGKSVDALYSKSLSCSSENQQLSSLRDFLLPMLMNGQVKVGKAGV